ncbi:hypothetical protein [Curtobacterium sp. MCBD17_040]|uniref:hypothetical protein n=1 Tax=Curtobacterium sp. MCBD17_040 TaxID=2175674 RepID=UPI0015E877F0|nr:hypothetical protein [Curtobacterium sp. MCBD17_040]WIB65828.1 hypothetical protein DEI94_17080 [Curtobacterium sp. MCBD17_040]
MTGLADQLDARALLLRAFRNTDGNLRSAELFTAAAVELPSQQRRIDALESSGEQR